VDTLSLVTKILITAVAFIVVGYFGWRAALSTAMDDPWKIFIEKYGMERDHKKYGARRSFRIVNVSTGRSIWLSTARIDIKDDKVLIRHIWPFQKIYSDACINRSNMKLERKGLNFWKWKLMKGDCLLIILPRKVSKEILGPLKRQ